MQRIIDETDLTNYPPDGEGEHASYRLVERIIALSVAGAWHQAKQEWEIARIFFADSDAPGTCLCGHSPIIEHCVLRNRLNGKIAVVGNVCVTKFLGLFSEKLFSALRRVARNPEAALNAETIHHAYARGWITPWEKSFYLDTWEKRRLSARQRAKRVEINCRVLAHTAACREACRG
jgi:hypothetical protein